MSRLKETRENISSYNKKTSDLMDKKRELLRMGIEQDFKIEAQLSLMSIAESLSEINETLAIICDKLKNDVTV